MVLAYPVLDRDGWEGEPIEFTDRETAEDAFNAFLDTVEVFEPREGFRLVILGSE